MIAHLKQQEKRVQMLLSSTVMLFYLQTGVCRNEKCATKFLKLEKQRLILYTGVGFSYFTWGGGEEHCMTQVYNLAFWGGGGEMAGFTWK